MAQMTALRRRMIDDMTVRNLSPATQQSYVYAVAKFSRFFGCSPDRLGIEEVRAYQLHLAGLGWSWSHINQVSCALRFFFGVTLGRPEAFDRIISAKEPKKLPVVLSGEEIVSFLQAVPGLRNRAALTTAYGAGLRVCEVAALKVGDIDSSRMVIRVEHGKGGKDRYVMLSPQLLRILRAYWRLTKPGGLAVPRPSGRSAGQHRDIANGLPGGRARGGSRQAGHRSHAAPQLRHAPARSRHRYPHHPGVARPWPAGDDGDLYPRCHQCHRRHAQPPRSPESLGNAARLRGVACAAFWRWRMSSAATVPLTVRPMPAI